MLQHLSCPAGKRPSVSDRIQGPEQGPVRSCSRYPITLWTKEKNVQSLFLRGEWSAFRDLVIRQPEMRADSRRTDFDVILMKRKERQFVRFEHTERLCVSLGVQKSAGLGIESDPTRYREDAYSRPSAPPHHLRLQSLHEYCSQNALPTASMLHVSF